MTIERIILAWQWPWQTNHTVKITWPDCTFRSAVLIILSAAYYLLFLRLFLHSQWCSEQSSSLRSSWHVSVSPMTGWRMQGRQCISLKGPAPCPPGSFDAINCLLLVSPSVCNWAVTEPWNCSHSVIDLGSKAIRCHARFCHSDGLQELWGVGQPSGAHAESLVFTANAADVAWLSNQVCQCWLSFFNGTSCQCLDWFQMFSCVNSPVFKPVNPFQFKHQVHALAAPSAPFPKGRKSIVIVDCQCSLLIVNAHSHCDPCLKPADF